LPPHDASLPVADDAGRTPGQAVVELIDAANDSQWKTMYSLYATPAVDFATAEKSWLVASQTYEDFRVLEVRVVSPEAAYVRVAFTLVTTPIHAPSYSVEYAEPGEWWPVHKVDGLWKTQWDASPETSA